MNVQICEIFFVSWFRFDFWSTLRDEITVCLTKWCEKNHLSLLIVFEHSSPNSFVKNAEGICLTTRSTIFYAKNHGRPWWLPIPIWRIWFFWPVEVQISFLDFVPEESMIEDKNLRSEVQIWFLEFVTKQKKNYSKWWVTWFIKFYLQYLFKEMFT